MWRTVVMIVIVAAASAVACTLPTASAAGRDPSGGLRVGVYDSRSIAVAYAASVHNPVAGKMQAYAEAKEAGDEKRVKELEQWGEAHQRQLHRQGFGRVPVTDLLEHVKDRLPEVAEKTGVSVIAFECNYVEAGVEKVDVTMELVELFDPSEETRKTAMEMLRHDPVDLDDLRHDH